MTSSLRRLFLAFALLALALSAASAGDDAKPGEKDVAAIRAVVEAMRSGPSMFGPEPAPWLLWRRYGLEGTLGGEIANDVLNASGDLYLLVYGLRHHAEAPTVEVGAVSGAAPHRHAFVRVKYGKSESSGGFDVLFVEEDGWKVARAGMLESPDEPLPRAGPRTPGPEDPSAELPAGLVARANELLRAIDDDDAKAFASRCVLLGDAGLVEPPLKDVAALVTSLHGKYGARPHQVGQPAKEAWKGREAWAVPVLFGEAEDLLYFVLTDALGSLRLASFSEGRPSDFVALPKPSSK